jgi:hypothetical protein
MEMQEQFRNKTVQGRNKTRYGRGICFHTWFLALKDANNPAMMGFM